MLIWKRVGSIHITDLGLGLSRFVTPTSGCDGGIFAFGPVIVIGTQSSTGVAALLVLHRDRRLSSSRSANCSSKAARTSHGERPARPGGAAS